MLWLTRARTAALFDSSLLITLAFRVWQGSAGLITIVVVGWTLTPEEQGCYYTLASVLSLQILSDLGLYNVIVSIASHEWARLRLEEGRLAGDRDAHSRLVHLGRSVIVWYGITAVVSGIGIFAGGLWFFGLTVPNEIEWRSPWIVLVTVSTVALGISPLVSLLEGCNQVATVNRYRLVFAVASSVAAWTTMRLGFGLWALPAAAIVLLSRDAVLLGVRFRGFFSSFFARRIGSPIRWRSEIWPMQWRLALQGLSLYVATQLFTPVLMYYHGPIIAGRMGMTWAAVSGIQMVALSWIHARVPLMGMLAARGEVRVLRGIWRRSVILSVAGVAIGGALLCAAVTALTSAAHPFAGRLLPLGATALLVAGACCSQVIQGLAAYLRAHKRELLTAAGVLSSVTCGGLTWILGRTTAGATGVGLAYAVAMALVGLPVAVVIWSSATRTEFRTGA